MITINIKLLTFSCFPEITDHLQKRLSLFQERLKDYGMFLPNNYLFHVISN